MLKKAIGSFIIQFTGSIFGFLFQFLAAKFLGAEEYGKYNYYFGFIGSIGVFFFFGFSYYLPKIIHQSDKSKLISEVITSHLLIFLPASVILFYFLNLSFKNFNITFLVLFGIYVFSLIEIMRSYYVADSRPIKAAFLKSFLLNLFMILIFFISLNFNKTFWILLIAFIVSHLIILLPFVIKNLHTLKPNFNLLKGAFSFYIVQVLYTTYAHFSKVIQGEFQSYEIIAVLSISIVVGKIITMLGTNFSLVLMPEFSKAWSNGNFKLIEKYFNQISRINIYIITPISIFMIMNTNRILQFLGDGFVDREIIFILIIFSSTITAFVGPNGAVLLMTGNDRKEITNGFLMLFSGLILGLIFGPIYYFGIALSIASAEIIIAISKRIMTYRILNLRFINKKTLSFMFLIMVVELVIFNFLSFIDNSIFWILLNLSSLTIFVLLSFFLSPNKSDKLFIFSFFKIN